MEIEIIEKNDNLLLERTEVRLIAKHPNEPTPRRKELKEALTEALESKKGIIVIDTMEPEFGRNETKVFVKVYGSIDTARKIESEYILKRNGLFEEKKKAEGS
ncbi:hypothetical protein B6U90_03530 [Thermoplasmatales archaeon ex4484_6]|nr:MAG: hypothetical protein B6U90_03530 [Thermoplasmatales archaeon ex4484_6]RLF67395.1 MAG: hypothetical protein DRN57_05835 [Thermoplasmata archaeon]